MRSLSFFTGTTDNDLSWIQSLGPENPPVPILMISGEWDDILTPGNAELLFQRLGGDEAANERRLALLPALVHNYEPFSFQVLFEIAKWKTSLDQPVTATIRIWGWLLGLVGIFLLVTGATRWAMSTEAKSTEPALLEIKNVKRFLWDKLLL